jgi:hypothetical protein
MTTPMLNLWYQYRRRREIRFLRKVLQRGSTEIEETRLNWFFHQYEPLEQGMRERLQTKLARLEGGATPHDLQKEVDQRRQEYRDATRREMEDHIAAEHRGHLYTGLKPHECWDCRVESRRRRRRHFFRAKDR